MATQDSSLVSALEIERYLDKDVLRLDDANSFLLLSSGEANEKNLIEGVYSDVEPSESNGVTKIGTLYYVVNRLGVVGVFKNATRESVAAADSETLGKRFQQGGSFPVKSKSAVKAAENGSSNSNTTNKNANTNTTTTNATAENAATSNSTRLVNGSGKTNNLNTSMAATAPNNATNAAVNNGNALNRAANAEEQLALDPVMLGSARVDNLSLARRFPLPAHPNAKNLEPLYSAYSSKMEDTALLPDNYPWHDGMKRYGKAVGCVWKRPATTNKTSGANGDDAETLERKKWGVEALEARYSQGLGTTCVGTADDNLCGDKLVPQRPTLGYVWPKSAVKDVDAMRQLYRGYSNKPKDFCTGVKETTCHGAEMKPLDYYMYRSEYCDGVSVPLPYGYAKVGAKVERDSVGQVKSIAFDDVTHTVSHMFDGENWEVEKDWKTTEVGLPTKLYRVTSLVTGIATQLRDRIMRAWVQEESEMLRQLQKSEFPNYPWMQLASEDTQMVAAQDVAVAVFASKARPTTVVKPEAPVQVAQHVEWYTDCPDGKVATCSRKEFAPKALLLHIAQGVGQQRVKKIKDWKELARIQLNGQWCKVWRAGYTDVDRNLWVALGDVLIPESVSTESPANAEREGYGPYFYVRRELLRPLTSTSAKKLQWRWGHNWIVANTETKTFFYHTNDEEVFNRDARWFAPRGMNEILRCCLPDGGLSSGQCGSDFFGSTPACDIVMNQVCRLPTMQGHKACACIQPDNETQSHLLICHSPNCLSSSAYNPHKALQWKKQGGCPTLCSTEILLRAGGSIKTGAIDVNTACTEIKREVKTEAFKVPDTVVDLMKPEDAEKVEKSSSNANKVTNTNGKTFVQEKKETVTEPTPIDEPKDTPPPTPPSDNTTAIIVGVSISLLVLLLIIGLLIYKFAL